MEPATLSETEIAEYCRKKEHYPVQIIQWKQTFLQVSSGYDQAVLKQVQKDNKQMKKELLRKEMALAEAAALLVLQKKLSDYYGETDEDD